MQNITQRQRRLIQYASHMAERTVLTIEEAEEVFERVALIEAEMDLDPLLHQKEEIGDSSGLAESRDFMSVPGRCQLPSAPSRVTTEASDSLSRGPLQTPPVPPTRSLPSPSFNRRFQPAVNAFVAPYNQLSQESSREKEHQGIEAGKEFEDVADADDIEDAQHTDGEHLDVPESGVTDKRPSQRQPAFASLPVMPERSKPIPKQGLSGKERRQQTIAYAKEHPLDEDAQRRADTAQGKLDWKAGRSRRRREIKKAKKNAGRQ